MGKDARPATIFCDIDGTLVEHINPHKASMPNSSMKLLEGTAECLLNWDKKGYRIILTTGRKESLREQTEKQLKKCGIFYDQLVMGIGGGRRYLINDKKENGEKYAACFNVDRNKGLKEFEALDIESLAMRYFFAFEEKNIDSLKNMFASKISLRDWNVSAKGVEDVININKEIFDSFENIKIKVMNIHISEMTAIAEIVIKLDTDEILVTDIIEFDKHIL